ncbi:MAG: FadR family transcriptional regulator [Deltaproteobacteria bacterium]|nr:FadR family transcriptional regulator [Deltaproteobacteria bacterium]
MPIQVIDTDRLDRKIAKMLSELIASGEFVPGQRLPGERDLARQLGVSRPSVREALIALEVEGKVEVRVGSGVFVCAPRSLPNQVLLEQGEGPFELIRARWVVEGETAAIATREASAADREEMREALEDLRQSQSARESEDADRRLHVAIGNATQNGPLAGVVQLLWDQGRGALWRQMEHHFTTPQLWAGTLRDHEAVVLAIESGNPQRARKAMHEHLTRVHREFARGFTQRRRRSKPPARRSGP